ncbi:MAG: zinc metalloprotease [Chitinophagaceae bacterium]
MGEAFLEEEGILRIRSTIYFYGDAADSSLSQRVGREMNEIWNSCPTIVHRKGRPYQVVLDIEGIYAPLITPDLIHANLDPQSNFFRVETFSQGNISFVDEIASNTGYFQLDNLVEGSTTAAHEFGHSLGLGHPVELDYRGKGRPSIMHPRGTLVDPEFQYDLKAPAGTIGGTLNPFTRRVTREEILKLRLEDLQFNRHGRVIIGDFTNLFHPRQYP